MPEQNRLYESAEKILDELNRQAMIYIKELELQKDLGISEYNLLDLMMSVVESQPDPDYFPLLVFPNFPVLKLALKRRLELTEEFAVFTQPDHLENLDLMAQPELVWINVWNKEYCDKSPAWTNSHLDPNQRGSTIQELLAFNSTQPFAIVQPIMNDHALYFSGTGIPPYFDRVPVLSLDYGNKGGFVDNFAPPVPVVSSLSADSAAKGAYPAICWKKLR